MELPTSALGPVVTFSGYDFRPDWHTFLHSQDFSDEFIRSEFDTIADYLASGQILADFDNFVAEVHELA